MHFHVRNSNPIVRGSTIRSTKPETQAPLRRREVRESSQGKSGETAQRIGSLYLRSRLNRTMGTCTPGLWRWGSLPGPESERGHHRWLPWDLGTPGGTGAWVRGHPELWPRPNSLRVTRKAIPTLTIQHLTSVKPNQIERHL